MKPSDWVNIVAIVFGPLVALQLARWQERRRERRERQFQVFRTLMSTRALRATSSDHVKALNMIDVEFHGRSNPQKAVLAAWKEYLDHLNTPGAPDNVWIEKMNALFVNLLYEMSRCLGYDFDRVHIKKQSYSPMSQGETDNEQLAIRKGLVAILHGERAILFKLVDFSPASSQALPDARVGEAQAPALAPRASEPTR